MIIFFFNIHFYSKTSTIFKTKIFKKPAVLNSDEDNWRLLVNVKDQGRPWR